MEQEVKNKEKIPVQRNKKVIIEENKRKNLKKRELTIISTSLKIFLNTV